MWSWRTEVPGNGRSGCSVQRRAKTAEPLSPKPFTHGRRTQGSGADRARAAGLRMTTWETASGNHDRVRKQDASRTQAADTPSSMNGMSRGAQTANPLSQCAAGFSSSTAGLLDGGASLGRGPAAGGRGASWSAGQGAQPGPAGNPQPFFM
jgi:hypothetical protein